MEEKINTSELAGHCTELAAWQVLKEVSEILLQKGLQPVGPHCIEISDDGHFMLVSNAALASHNGFDAPEVAEGQLAESSVVWSLGASLFFIGMGHQVMNGKGGKGQRGSSKLPYMRSEWPELSELVQQCLQFIPARRPTLQQVHDKAAQHYQHCIDEIRKGPKYKTSVNTSQTETDHAGQELAFWPETMRKPNV